jgi:hypothetical protein
MPHLLNALAHGIARASMSCMGSTLGPQVRRLLIMAGVFVVSLGVGAYIVPNGFVQNVRDTLNIPTTYTWNQKLSVTVMTPDGERSGSAITQIIATVYPNPLLGNLQSHTVKGEATVVEIGNDKYLFALLSSGGQWTATEYLAEVTFAQHLPLPIYQGTVEGANSNFKTLQTLRKSLPIPLDKYPLLVTFTDIKDPKSVKEVKPNQLADILGPGHSLKSITLEISDEVAKKGQVENVVPWLGNKDLILVDWTRYPTGHPLRKINVQSFQMGN